MGIDRNHILSRTDLLTSFATSLAIDAPCNYESIVILKYFTSEGLGVKYTCCTLMQLLIIQLSKQHPSVFRKEESSISPSTLRDAGHKVPKDMAYVQGLSASNQFGGSISSLTALMISLVIKMITEFS